MGLITEKVEVRINSVNKAYYENLGYDIPKYYNNKKYKYVVKKDTTIWVDVNDLPINSRFPVQYMCDCCKERHIIQFATYARYKKDNDKYFCRKCALKLFNSGENHFAWNYNKTDEERVSERKYDEYIQFVKKVLVRDNYTCQYCGNKISDNLEVHHLNGYNWFIEGRTDEANAVVLCKNCHTNFHIKYGKGNNTKEQFEEWVGATLGELEKYNGILPTTKQAYCLEDNVIIDSIVNYSKTNNMSAIHLYECCNGVKSSAYGKHYVWYYDYLKMTDNEIKLLLMNSHESKQIICLNNQKIFKNAKCASTYYNIDRKGINNCCINKSKYIKDKNTKEKLYFKYLNEYMSENNISSINDLTTCDFIFNF